MCPLNLRINPGLDPGPNPGLDPGTEIDLNESIDEVSAVTEPTGFHKDPR